MSLPTLHVPQSVPEVAQRRRLTQLAGLAGAAVVAVALIVHGSQFTSARGASQANVVGGHEITYLPAKPYALSRGAGTCSTALVVDERACWAPATLSSQPVYTATAVPGPESTQLRLLVGGPSPATDTESDGFTTIDASVGGRPAVLRQMTNVAQLFFTLPDGTNAAIVALNIPVDEVQAFAAGIR